MIEPLQEEFGTAVILITHDLGVIAEVADEVLVMYAGAGDGDRPTGATLFYASHHPYTEGLLQSLPGLRRRARAAPAHRGPAAEPDQPPAGLPVRPRCAYVMDRCRTETPPLDPRGDEPGHRSACWLPHDMAARKARRKVAQSNCQVAGRSVRAWR